MANGIGSKPIAQQPIGAWGVNSNAGGVQQDIQDLQLQITQLQSAINAILSAVGGGGGFLK